MKKLICLLLLPLFGWAQSESSWQGLEAISKSEQHRHFHKTSATQAAHFNYDVHHYRCHWEVDPAVNDISGSVNFLFTPTQSVLDTFTFDMSNTLVVDSVIYRGQNMAYTHSQQRVNIYANTVNMGVDSILVYYHGSPNSSGLGTFETALTPHGDPVLWTLSQPYGSSEWWPCKNNLQDKADSIDIFITAPSVYKAASNGLLQSENIQGGLKTTHWKHRYPIATYLICLAVSDYASFTHYAPHGNDSIPILNYVYPKDSATDYPQAAKVVDIMGVFDSLFGEYPFHQEQYGHCRTGIGGGMEHQTFSFMGSYDFQLMAHEAAHQWFGDFVTCNSWEDIWLNEGFATYLTGLTYEALAPQYWDLYINGNRNYATSQPDGSVFCDDTTDVFRIFDPRLSYVKGSMVLHQLRWYIGDSAFYAGCNNYLNDPTLSFGFAGTGKLISHMELASGRNLKNYFDDWYFGEGHPSYHLNYSHIGDTVYLMVNQTQSHPSVSFFEMDLPVFLHTTNTVTEVRLNYDYNNQLYKIFFSGMLDSLTLDDNFWLLYRDNTYTVGLDESISNSQIQVYPNPYSSSFWIDSPIEYDYIEIYDVTGRPVLQKKVEYKAQLKIETFLANGNYVLVLKNREKTIYHKNIITQNE